MAEDKISNFIAISRKIFDHEFWEEERSYSKFEAWVDLIQSAFFKEDEIKSEWVNNKEVKYKRGQLIASVRFLQKRWNWGSITKVERFLNVLKNKDMVVLEKGQGVNVITICKYDIYNPKKKDERTAKGQGRGQQKDETNNVNKEIDNNISIYAKAIIDFKDMRKTIKKPLSVKALEIIESKLTGMCGNDEELKVKVLHQSIENSWQSVFPLKINQQQNKYSPIEDEM